MRTSMRFYLIILAFNPLPRYFLSFGRSQCTFSMHQIFLKLTIIDSSILKRQNSTSMFFTILKMTEIMSSIFIQDLTRTLKLKTFEISFVNSFRIQNNECTLTFSLIVNKIPGEFVAFFVDQTAFSIFLKVLYLSYVKFTFIWVQQDALTHIVLYLVYAVILNINGFLLFLKHFMHFSYDITYILVFQQRLFYCLSF